MTKCNPKVLKTHRRCSSYPETLERNLLWAKSTKNSMSIINSRCEEAQELEVAQAIVDTPQDQSKSDLEMNNAKQTESILCETSHISHPASDSTCSESPVKGIESKNDSVKMSFDKIKAWNSLPSLLHIGLSGDSRDRSLTVTSKSWLLTRSNSSRSTKARGGSQTLPSTPYRSVKNITNAPNRSATAESKLFALDNSAVISKLSPSVLQVDYSGLQHSDSPDILKHSRTVLAKKHHSTKQSITKSQGKLLGKNGRITNEDGTPIKKRVNIEGSKLPRNLNNHPSVSQKSDDCDTLVKNRPKSKETAIPLKISRSITCDSMAPIKSPPLLSPR